MTSKIVIIRQVLPSPGRFMVLKIQFLADQTLDIYVFFEFVFEFKACFECILAQKLDKSS